MTIGGPSEPRGPVMSEVLPGREQFPSRGKPLSSPIQWLKDKAQVDGELLGIPPELWCVHGKLYDLGGFMSRHPGGREWLELTRGSDITDAVETHHLDMGKVQAILAKTFVRDAPKAKAARAKARFTFADDDFYRTLKRRAVKVLGASSAGHGPTAAMHAVSATLLAGWLACFVGMCAFGGTALPLLAAAVGATFLHALMGVGHNFFHQANNAWMYVFDLSLFQSHTWRISHAMSHHLYPNLEIDIEVSSLEPILYYLTNKPRNNALVYISFHLFLLFASTADCIRHYCLALIGVDKLRPENVLVWLEVAALSYFQGFGWGIKLFLLHQMLASWLLAALSFAVHRSGEAWTEGDADPQLDYGRHIVASTSDHSVSCGLLRSFYCFAGLNYHILHHLFPTVDHSRLKELNTVFLETLAEFNIEYHTFDFGKLFRGSLRRHDMTLVPK